MDSIRVKSSARNGAGLRQGEMVQRTSTLVGRMASRSASICPYCLGPSSSTVEGMARPLVRGLTLSRVSAVIVGIGLSVMAVIYF